MTETKHLKHVPDKLLNLAIHAAPSGILVTDWKGIIVFVNESLLKMFGYTEDQLLGKSVDILIPQEYAAAHQHHIYAYTNRPSPRDMGMGKYFYALRKDGLQFPVEIGLSHGEIEDGKIVVASIINVTQRKLIEDRLLQHEEDLESLIVERTKKLHEAQAEKERAIEQLIQAEKMTAIGTLTSGIGHEINNPLYAILGFAEAIQEEKTVEQCHDYSAQIIKHVKDISAIVKNFSGYAQPSSKHDFQLINVNECTSAAVAMVNTSLKNDNVVINCQLQSLPEILAKSEEIQQILFNIIRNAVQSIYKKGEVNVTTQCQDGWVIVCIQDTGKGISEAEKNKVFDPFFTTKGPDEGEGLGLYVVQKIVQKYQGKIDLESKRGVGSTFTIQLPVPQQN